MNFKYKNYEIKLQEDIEQLKQEVQELQKLADLIKNAPHYKILEGKTQLIGKNKTESMRSRSEHSENITKIAISFIKALYEIVVDDEIKDDDIYKLNLKKELLYAQIISKSHDWGHTPFGHLGERVINKLLQSTKIEPKNLKKILQRKKEIYGEQYEIQQGHTSDYIDRISFEHNEQSAKLMYDFVKFKDIDTKLVDLQRIINGILAHSTSRVKQQYIPNDIVSQIIRQADKLEEYSINDFDEIKDFINLDIITDKKMREYLNLNKEERLKITLQQLLEETLKKGHIDDEMTSLEYSNKMKRIHHNHIFFIDNDGKKGLLTGENEERITVIISRIFEYYMLNHDKVPSKSMHYIYPVHQKNVGERVVLEKYSDGENVIPEEKVIDYICQMSNEFAEKSYYKLVKERLVKGEGYGVLPITEQEISEIMKKTLSKEINFIRLCEEKDGTEHSKEECKKKFEEITEKLKKEILTSKARKRIQYVRTLHERENKIDLRLLELLNYYDNNPEKRIEINDDKRKQAAINLKNKWQKSELDERK